MQRVTKPSGLTLTVLVFLMLCSIVLPASAAQISVEPSSQTVTKGENFTVDIYVDPEGSVTVAVDYILHFNNTLLNATSLTHGTFFDGFTTDDTYGLGINNTMGTVDYGELIWPWPTSGEGVINPGTVTTITFQAIAEEDGVSELSFKTVTLSDPNGAGILTNVSNGNVSVKAGIPGDVDGMPGVTTNDGRQIFMNLLYPGQYSLTDEWAADCDGLCDGITTNDGRQIFMSLLYPGQYLLECC
jgi:hypothetical protein